AVNLLPETEIAPGTIDLTSAAPTTNPVTAELQTERFSYATEGRIPPKQIRDSVLLGFEDILREQVYHTQALEDRAAKNRTIQDVSQAAALDGRGLTDEEIFAVTELAGSGYERSPKTVLEALYAKRFVEDLTKEVTEFQQ